MAQVRELATQITAQLRPSASPTSRQMFFQQTPAGCALHQLLLDDDGVPCDYIFTEVNAAFEALTGWRAEHVVGQRVSAMLPPDESQGLIATFGAVVQTGVAAHLDITMPSLKRTYSVNAFHTVDQEFAAVFTDISVQHDTEAALRHSEANLQQAHKMEAIGRLTGGIAHDFNNLLTTILGTGELWRDRLAENHPDRRDLDDILHAAARAAALTRQLLAFGRRQVLQPIALDLNTSITAVAAMLRRVIGEDVQLATLLDPHLGTVLIDPTQVDQVLLNLAVNARDAMPHGGSLTIETRNVVLDEGYAEAHFPVLPGPYVLMAVTDSGCGMPPEVRARAFEPFFTTKPIGRGTGLGLSMVYGVVKQSGGYIWLYSEADRGTSVKIYLPRLPVAAATRVETPRWTSSVALGTETVLLVEDDDALRRLALRVLQSAGYDVAAAPSAEAALAYLDEADRNIDLLLTDVVLPGANGRVLADQIRARWPGVRVLFMSGYTDEANIRRGTLSRGTHFLNKPYTPRALAAKVREVLDAPSS